MKRIYTEEHIQFLRDNITGRRYKEVARLFNEHFGMSVSDHGIKTLLTRNKIGNNKGRGLQGIRKIYFEEHIEFLKRIAPGHSYVEITRLFNEQFEQEKTVKEMQGTLKNYNIINGRDTRIKLGNIPFNKGKKGCYASGCEKTWFPKGHTPENCRPVGSERTNINGYVEVKVCDPKTWKAKHAVLWEQKNGPIPKGHVVVFADGDKTNFDLSNLILVSRKELAVLNHMRLLSPDADITKTAVNIARIKVLAADRKKEKT